MKWVGARLPYIGDSVAANMLFDREDTPLQADISSASIAQTLLFGVCGIKVLPGQKISICPPENRPAERVNAGNIRLCGKTISISIDGDDFCVESGSTAFSGKTGEDTVTI